MKVNNPIIDVKKPILVNNKDEYNVKVHKLTKMGYKWLSGNKLTEYIPMCFPTYLYCYSDFTIVWDDQKDMYNYHI